MSYLVEAPEEYSGRKRLTGGDLILVNPHTDTFPSRTEQFPDGIELCSQHSETREFRKGELDSGFTLPGVFGVPRRGDPWFLHVGDKYDALEAIEHSKKHANSLMSNDLTLAFRIDARKIILPEDLFQKQRGFRVALESRGKFYTARILLVT